MEFNFKQLLFDSFVNIIDKKFNIDLSGLQNPTELFNFLKILHQIYILYERYKKGTSIQSEINKLNCELDEFCKTYKNVLPEEFLRQADQVGKNPDAFLQSFYLRILSLWGNLGAGYIVAQAMMYIAQWRNVINTKKEMKELIDAGHSYVEINQILIQIEILRKKANDLNQLVEEYQWSKQSNNHLLEQIRNQLKITNEYHYEPIMKDVEKLKQNLENENESLSGRRENVGIWEKASYVGVGIGIAMALFSAYDSKQNKGVSRVNPKLGWTVAAASAGSLGLSTSEKWRVDGRLDLVKDRLNRLAEVDQQLVEIKAMLNKFENAIN